MREWTGLARAGLGTGLRWSGKVWPCFHVFRWRTRISIVLDQRDILIGGFILRRLYICRGCSSWLVNNWDLESDDQGLHLTHLLYSFVT